MNILIVEDDRRARNLLFDMINSMGNHDVSVLTNGRNAVALLADPEHNFDLVFLDLHMPRMDGQDVIQILSDIVKINIVVITGDASRFPNLPSHIPVISKPYTHSMISALLIKTDAPRVRRNRNALLRLEHLSLLSNSD